MKEPPATMSAPRLAWLLGALVAAWTFVVFLSTVWNGFVNWDDPAYFLDNPYHHQAWPARFMHAWNSHLVGEYMPVTITTFSLDRSLWGLSAPGYHLTSVVLHVLASVLVFMLARHLLRHVLGADPPGSISIDVGAAAAALVFSLHPLRVEPVAWVSARGTVLGGLLLVLTVLLYVVGWERGRSAGRVPARWLAASIAAFVASLLARAPGLVLTAVLVVLDVYPLRRLGPRPREWGRPAARRAWAEKAPFAVISVLAVLMGFLARGHEVGEFGGVWDPVVAIAWATYSAGFYVWKAVMIGTLSPIYAMPTRDDFMPAMVALSTITWLAVTAFLLAMRRRWPGALTAWVVYLIMLGPISGIVPFGRLRGVVDRYTYAACIGWALVAGGAIAMIWRARAEGRASRLRVIMVTGALVIVLVGWSVVSWRQAEIWEDGVTLWSRAVAVTPRSAVAQSNLGTALAARGYYATAARHYQEAAREWPQLPWAFQNLGRALAADARYAEAEPPFRRVVELRPDLAEAHLDLGTVLYNMGQVDEAVSAFTRAVELDPGSARAHENLGTALRRLGREAEAASHFRKASALGWTGHPGSDLVVPGPGATGADGS
jgi:Tfp pilus assembly protein PilF